MKQFKFRFASLLTLRENERDLRRQFLAEAMRQVEKLELRRRALEGTRQLQLDEMRQLGAPGEVQVDGATARRAYAGQVTAWILEIDQDLQTARHNLEVRRQELVLADQQVRVLENLRDKQLAEYQSEAERRDARQLEEAWLGAHSGEFRR